jgi:DNA-binding LacI/PurR family transcriptional regulator
LPSRPTLRTVAEAAGVAVMTVSNAYSRPHVLSDETLHRVMTEAARLGYPGPHAGGRSLRIGRSDTVAVVLSQRLPDAFSDPGIAAFLSGVAGVLTEKGQAMLLLPMDGPAALGLIRNAIVDALILCNLPAESEAVGVARGRRLPLVTVGSPRIVGVPFVGVDNRKAAAAAGRHLLTLGHSKIGVLTLEPGTQDDIESRFYVHDRVDGFLHVLERAGIPRSAVQVLRARSNTRKEGERIARSLVSAKVERRPSAVFAVTDLLALGVLDAAATAGVSVPSELSVVGFDDIDQASRVTPALTTVSFALYKQGRAAAAAVLSEAIDGKRPVLRITTRLRIRATTAAPASS